MARKTQQLQIRVSREEKAVIRRLARTAGMDLSTYVLARAIPNSRTAFEELIRSLGSGPDDPAFVLAALNDLLSGLSAPEVGDAAEGADLSGLSAFHRCYVAAMVEEAAYRLGTRPPEWTVDVPALAAPYFATDLPGLRLHLLRSAPVAFKRRNIFIDSTLGDRV